MKLIYRTGLLILAVLLVLVAGLCGCSAFERYYYPIPGELVPYENIIEEYHPIIVGNISEREVQELFTILKNLYDAGGHEYGARTIYIPEPYVRINLYVISMERGGEYEVLRARRGDEIIENRGDEIIEVVMGVHEGDRYSLHGWATVLYFDRVLWGGWYLIYYSNIQE